MWPTVRNGRYGERCKYILTKGGDALAPAISDYLLKEAKDTGYMTEYKQENAEVIAISRLKV